MAAIELYRSLVSASAIAGDAQAALGLANIFCKTIRDVRMPSFQVAKHTDLTVTADIQAVYVSLKSEIDDGRQAIYTYDCDLPN